MKLSKKGPAVWKFRDNVNAQANTATERFIHGAQLRVVDSSGRSQRIKDFAKGYAFFDLENGRYTFKFSAPGYRPN